MAPVGKELLSRSRPDSVADSLQTDASIVSSAYEVQGKQVTTTERHSTLTRPELRLFRRLLDSILVLLVQNRPPSHHSDLVGDFELPYKVHLVIPMDRQDGIAASRHQEA